MGTTAAASRCEGATRNNLPRPITAAINTMPSASTIREKRSLAFIGVFARPPSQTRVSDVDRLHEKDSADVPRHRGVVASTSRKLGHATTGWRGYFTASAVHITKSERAARTARWLAHRQHRLSANGRASGSLTTRRTRRLSSDGQLDRFTRCREPLPGGGHVSVGWSVPILIW